MKNKEFQSKKVNLIFILIRGGLFLIVSLVLFLTPSFFTKDISRYVVSGLVLGFGILYSLSFVKVYVNNEHLIFAIKGIFSTKVKYDIPITEISKIVYEKKLIVFYDSEGNTLGRFRPFVIKDASSLFSHLRSINPNIEVIKR